MAYVASILITCPGTVPRWEERGRTNMMPLPSFRIQRFSTMGEGRTVGAS